MPNDQPVTRAELVELLSVQKGELLELLAVQKAEILEALEKTETKLLRAFFQYQEHADIRFRKMSADVSNVNTSAELRLNNLEQRVVEIEKRLLMGGPPPQA